MILGSLEGLSVTFAAVVPLTPYESVIDFYLGRSTAEQIAIVTASTLLLGAVLFGVLPAYSNRALKTARKSPIISFLIGIPTAGVLGMFFYLGMVLSESSFGIFFAIPLVTVTLGLLPAWATVGVVSTGSAIGTRLGTDGLAVSIVLGALVVGASAVVVESLIVVGGLVTCLGVGAGVRVLVSGGMATDPDQRTVPPANKM